MGGTQTAADANADKATGYPGGRSCVKLYQLTINRQKPFALALKNWYKNVGRLEKGDMSPEIFKAPYKLIVSGAIG